MAIIVFRFRKWGFWQASILGKVLSDLLFFSSLLLTQTLFLIFIFHLKSMEVKNQKSQQGSEISYLKLENSRDVQTPEQGQFILKQVFLKHLLQDKPLHLNQHKKTNLQAQFNYQSDEGFLHQLFQIVEKHQPEIENLQQKKELDQSTCQYIDKLCLRHREANKFNIYSDFDSKNIPAEMKCFCGCGKAEGDPLPLCTDQLQHYFFGPTILVFFFMRKIVIALLVISLTFGIYSVVTNLITAPEIGDQCILNPGMLFFLCQAKFQVNTLNKSGHQIYFSIQIWLGVLLCLTWILSIRVIRSMGRILNKKIDSLLDSSSDYVIQIYNLPIGQYTETELLKYIGSLWQKMKGKNSYLPMIKSVQIVYKMDQPRSMIENIIECSRRLVTNLIKKEKEGKFFYSIKQGHLQNYLKSKMELIKSMIQIQEYRQKFINNPQFRKALATDIAFIQFKNTNDQAQLLSLTKQYRLTIIGELKQYIKSKFFQLEEDSYVFKSSNIRITRAPEPSDIKWKNCEKKNSYKRVAFVWIIAILMVCISFGFQTLIRFLRTNFSVLESLSILVSISLQAFNRIIWNTLVWIVDFQENNTTTDNVISIMSKGAFAQAMNVLVVPLISNYLMRKNLYGSEGLIGSTLDYHFTFFFMQIFLHFINVPYQVKRMSILIPCIRNWIIRKYSKVVGVVDTTQQIKQVLQYYEPPSFSIASVYTSVNTIIFHTVFYIHIQPILIFSLVFNILAVYTIYKYLLLRRFKIPQIVDFIIFENCCSYLQHVPLIYSIGSITFIYITDEADTGFTLRYIPSIFCIFLWFFCILNPCSIINKISKAIVNRLGYVQVEVYQKEKQGGSEKIGEEITQQEGLDQRIFQRRQSYYSACGTNDLLEYEATLTEIKRDQDYESLNKLFCERFNMKPTSIIENSMPLSTQMKNSQKKSSMKMLSKIKQNFSMVNKEAESRESQKKIKGTFNNKIMPIDIYKFHEKGKIKLKRKTTEEGEVKGERKSILRKDKQMGIGKQGSSDRQKKLSEGKQNQKNVDDTKNRLVIKQKQQNIY